MESLSSRAVRTALLLSGLAVAGGAIALTASVGDPISPLFQHAFAGPILLAIVAWGIVAIGVRWVRFGRSKKNPLGPTASSVWVCVYLVLLIAVFADLAFLVIALTLGLDAEVRGALIRSLIFLVLLYGVTSMLGTALFNSLVAVSSNRTPRPD
jgi:hypothetical protein